MRKVLLALWMLGGVTLVAQLPPPAWNNVPAQPVAGVEHRTFRSQKAGTDVGYNVLLPPGYATGDRRYPVVYWLHGLGGNENSDPASLAPKALAAMQAGLPPVIVVFVNGADYTFYVDSPDRGVPAATILASELIAHVDATYRTIAERRGRAIEGFSMGGFGALHHAMTRPDLFGSVVAYAPALLEVQPSPEGGQTLRRAGGTHAGAAPESPALMSKNKLVFQLMFGGKPEVVALHSPYTLLRLHAPRLRTQLPVRVVIGTADGLWNAAQRFRTLMREHAYELEYEEVEGVPHNIGRLYDGVGAKGLAFHAKANGWR
jgi:S-formylglutathione hydrolase FrmB